MLNAINHALKQLFLFQKEQEKFDEYFDVREKTEGMEQKMASTKEIKCKAVSCKQVCVLNVLGCEN